MHSLISSPHFFNRLKGFLLPERAFKFRVDEGGLQYWSDVVNIIAGEVNPVELDLDLLALIETNDPHPTPRHGSPPGVMVASLGQVQGLILHAATASTPSQFYYFHNDHLGTPQVITDETGAVVWRAAYDPFGQANVAVQVIENNFRFPGQYYDQETGLHQNWFRDYAPGIGRYVEPDPSGVSLVFVTNVGRSHSLEDNSVYLYAANEPISNVDVFGLWYVDFNFNLGGPIGVTFGVMIGPSGIYGYGGGGLVSPSFAVTVSPNDPTKGWNVGLQGQYGLAGQIGYAFGEDGGWFGEVGGGGPSGVSLTGYYVVGLVEAVKNPEPCKK